VSTATDAPDRAGGPAPAPSAAAKRSWRSRGPLHTLLLQHDGVWAAAGRDGPCRWHANFDAWCETMRDTRCELLLSGTVVHDLVCDPGLPVASDKQLLEHGRAVFEHYHGEVAAHWQLACWSSSSQCGVSALHGANFAELLATAQRHGVLIGGMQPWWARVLRLVLRRLPALRTTPLAWLLIVEAGFANALCLKHGECAAVCVVWLDSPSPPALASFAAQLPARDGGAEAVILAMGFGLASGPVAGVEVLGRLDESVPSPAWLLEREFRP
jgi:hypothetical protein